MFRSPCLCKITRIIISKLNVQLYSIKWMSIKIKFNHRHPRTGRNTWRSSTKLKNQIVKVKIMRQKLSWIQTLSRTLRLHLSIRLNRNLSRSIYPSTILFTTCLKSKIHSGLRIIRNQPSYKKGRSHSTNWSLRRCQGRLLAVVTFVIRLLLIGLRNQLWLKRQMNLSPSLLSKLQLKWSVTTHHKLTSVINKLIQETTQIKCIRVIIPHKFSSNLPPTTLIW